MTRNEMGLGRRHSAEPRKNVHATKLNTFKNTHLRPQPQAQLPVRIARFVKNRRECVIVTLKEYAGVKLADIRVFAATNEGDLPTSKGVALDIRRLPDLKAAIERAEAEAQRLGLLSREGDGHDL